MLILIGLGAAPLSHFLVRNKLAQSPRSRRVADRNAVRSAISASRAFAWLALPLLRLRLRYFRATTEIRWRVSERSVPHTVKRGIERKRRESERQKERKRQREKKLTTKGRTCVSAEANAGGARGPLCGVPYCHGWGVRKMCYSARSKWPQGRRSSRWRVHLGRS